jgi:hypothetical protein
MGSRGQIGPDAPYLIYTDHKNNHPVGGKCSACPATFELDAELPVDEESSRAIWNRFEEHVQRRHKREHIYCNTCRRKTPHSRLKRVQLIETVEGEQLSERYFDVLQCCGCEELVLRRMFHYLEGSGFPPFSWDVRYFPPAMFRKTPDWHERLPGEFRSLLYELYKSLDSESLWLPLVGARTLVDMLMREKVGDIGGFKAKLKKLEEAGYLSLHGREVLESALEMGSAAAHRGFTATASDVQSVMDIVEHMLQAVYVFPEVAQRLKDVTPPRPIPKAGTEPPCK